MPRLEVLTTPSNYDGVRLQLEKSIEKHRDYFNFKMTQLPHMESAIKTLKDGSGDLLGMSITDWKKYDTSDLEIAAFLPRKEPTWVLVSEDKPEYLPYNAIIICDNILIQRQLLRMRKDLIIYTFEEYEIRDNSKNNPKPKLFDLKLEMLEELRTNENIDGYVLSRGQFSQTKGKLRRHTLGMQKDNPNQEFERARFIPPPLQGIAVLVSRSGFNKSTIDIINDSTTQLIYQIENSIYQSLSEELRGVCGIFVERQKFETVVKKYNKLMIEGYLTRQSESYLVLDDNYSKGQSSSRSMKNHGGSHNFDNNNTGYIKHGWSIDKDITKGPRVIIYFEILGENGEVTIEFVRVAPVEKNIYDRDRLVLIQEIKFILNILQRDHEEEKRKIGNLPEDYYCSKPGILKL